MDSRLRRSFIHFVRGAPKTREIYLRASVGITFANFMCIANELADRVLRNQNQRLQTHTSARQISLNVIARAVAAIPMMQTINMLGCVSVSSASRALPSVGDT